MEPPVQRIFPQYIILLSKQNAEIELRALADIINILNWVAGKAMKFECYCFQLFSNHSSLASSFKQLDTKQELMSFKNLYHNPCWIKHKRI